MGAELTAAEIDAIDAITITYQPLIKLTDIALARHAQLPIRAVSTIPAAQTRLGPD